jgi:midasin
VADGQQQQQQEQQQQEQQQQEQQQQQGDASMADAHGDDVAAAALALDDEAEDAAEAGLEGARGAIGGGRTLSSRDLLRWCARVCAAIQGLGVASLPPPSSPHLTGTLRELVLVEALDIFAGAIRKPQPQAQVCERLAQLWQVPPDRLHYIVALHKPQLQSTPSTLRVGRVTLPVAVAANVNTGTDGSGGLAVSGGAFAHTRQTLTLMERVAACVRMEEAVLLVGETGTGKTTAVQHLARSIGKELLVHNLSEQSDSSELIGGFRPVQMRHIFGPLAARFEAAFCQTFSRARNAALLDKLAQRLAKGEWKKLLQIMSGALRTVGAKLAATAAAAGTADAAGKADAAAGGGPMVNGAGSAMAAGTASSKRQRTAAAASPAAGTPGAPPGEAALPSELAEEWRSLSAEMARAQRQIDHPSEEGVAFAVVEGSLVRALREGHWLLLDEMNLASPETLERVAAVLEENGSVSLTERGEADVVKRHPDFRIFGAMNPPTDFGKKELPPGIRARFTELYVPPLTSSEDLQLVVLGVLKPVLPHPPVSNIVAFYHAAMAEAESTLLDGANQRPQFSLRTLCRALAYVAHALGSYGLERSLWDGFHMTFVTQLQQAHQPVCEALMLKHLLPPKRGGGPSKPPPMGAPSMPNDGRHWIPFGGFWIQADPRGEPRDDARYIVTPTVEARLQTVARMVAARRFPVLLQGPTSAGKTSMVERLARATGHRLVRINNHEHTDVQEYVGSFQPGATGRLEFCDGALTQAVRHGYWIVLDELNLAPSEVGLLAPAPFLCSPGLLAPAPFLCSPGLLARPARPACSLGLLARACSLGPAARSGLLAPRAHAPSPAAPRRKRPASDDNPFLLPSFGLE